MSSSSTVFCLQLRGESSDAGARDGVPTAERDVGAQPVRHAAEGRVPLLYGEAEDSIG